MTIREIIKQYYTKDIADFEIYETFGHGLHSDYINSVEYYSGLDRVEADFEIMSEEEYKDTILANTCDVADFGMWYGDPNAKVLIISIPNDTHYLLYSESNGDIFEEYLGTNEAEAIEEAEFLTEKYSDNYKNCHVYVSAAHINSDGAFEEEMTVWDIKDAQ